MMKNGDDFVKISWDSIQDLCIQVFDLILLNDTFFVATNMT